MHGTGKLRRHLLKSALALAVTAAVPRPARSTPARELYRWGSSSLGSSGYVIMEAFAQTVNRYTRYRNTSLATAGTAENLFLIGRGDLEFAHSTSVDWAIALAGQRPYTQPVRANQLFGYAVWQQVPIVHADSALRRLSDLAGRRFSPSMPGSGTAAMYNVLTQAADLHDRIKWRYGSWSEVYTAFRARQIDSVVGVLTNGTRSGGIQQLEASLDLRVLDVPRAVLARARARNPGIFEDSLDCDDWPVISGSVRVPMMTGIVAASTGVSDEVGYEVTRNILGRADEIRQIGGPLRDFDAQMAVRNLIPTAPVNAGAAEYFRETGVWRDELTVAA